MGLQIGDTAPDFEAQTTEGTINFHEWIGDSWAVLFSHPKDFTPVCTTELGYMAKIKPEFDRRNVKIIAVSVDPVDSHAEWASDIAETQGEAPNYPIIGDADFSVSKAYGMLPADVSGDPSARTPADNQTVRNVFVVSPDKKVKLILVYPMTTGRNFDEVIRVIDSLQLTADHKVATPANWKQGEDVFIAGSVSDDEAREIYPEGWTSPRRASSAAPPSAYTSEGPVSRGETGPSSFCGGCSCSGGDRAAAHEAQAAGAHRNDERAARGACEDRIPVGARPAALTILLGDDRRGPTRRDDDRVRERGVVGVLVDRGQPAAAGSAGHGGHGLRRRREQGGRRQRDGDCGSEAVKSEHVSLLQYAGGYVHTTARPPESFPGRAKGPVGVTGPTSHEA